MSAPCPHCHGTGVLPNGLDDTAAELRKSCSARGIVVAPDDTVSEPDAAKILNRSPFTLRNWRLYEDGGPAYTLSGVRARYSLSALADYRNKKSSY